MILIISSGMDVVSVGLYHQMVASSNRTIQSPASVGTEMWADHAVQSRDPYSTSIPPVSTDTANLAQFIMQG